MTTRLVLSASEHRDYCFGVVFASLFARDVVGFEPLVILVEDLGYWLAQPMRCRIALEALRELKIDVRFGGTVAGFETGRAGQNLREHAAVYSDLAEGAWLMMSDADLWMLRREFYHQHEDVPDHIRAVCLYSNGDHFQGKADVIAKADARRRFQNIPTCHVTMRVRDWRERYGLTIGEQINEATKRSMDRWLASQDPQDLTIWNLDQDLVTERLCRADWFPDNVIMIPREGNPPKDRLDRGTPERWDMPLDGRWTDAHVFRAPDTEPNWSKLRRVIAHYLPRRLAFADEFRAAFRGSYVD